MIASNFISQSSNSNTSYQSNIELLDRHSDRTYFSLQYAFEVIEEGLQGDEREWKFRRKSFLRQLSEASKGAFESFQIELSESFENELSQSFQKKLLKSFQVELLESFRRDLLKAFIVSF